MSRRWLGSADVTVNDATGALLVEQAEGGGPVASATVTSVAASTSAVTLLAANTGRRGAVVHNAGTGNLFVKLGTGAATNSYTYKLVPQAHLELPPAVFTGLISGVWDATGGSAAITELT